MFPKLQDIASPQDTLKDLREAIQILLEVKDRQDLIVIYGDYDVDGATSTALLLRGLRALGFKAEAFIPHRVEDGYGVTVKGSEKLLAQFPKAQLILTCDNGIGAFDGIEFLRSQNLKVIVTDHHEAPSRRVKAHAILNPKQPGCAYPDKKLAGVGVAFLLLMGLRRALEAKDFSLNRFLDLVAVGTVCDVAELTGTNRIFVKYGLPRIENSEFLGLRELAERCPSGAAKIKAKDLGFFVGPRLNASGRLGDPELGFKTLLAEDRVEAQTLVQQLETLNARRKSMQEEQLGWAKASLASRSPRLAIVLKDSRYHLGLVGLIAGRIAESFESPTCVLTRIDDEHEMAMFGQEALNTPLWKGSLRAPLGFHLAQALEDIKKAAPGLLVSGGGHAQAAGVALKEVDLEKFENLLQQSLQSQGKLEHALSYDAELEALDALSEVHSLLEPYGNGNPAPLIRIKDAKVSDVRKLKEIHLKFKAHKGRNSFSVLQFQSPWVSMLANGGGSPDELSIDFLAEPFENEWNGQVKQELLLKEVLGIHVKGKQVDVKAFGRSKNSDAISPS